MPSKASASTVKSVLQGLSAKVRLNGVMDAISNAVTGIGTARSKTAAGRYVQDDLLQPSELEILWESNDLASVIVGKIVEDALRAGFTIERTGGSPTDDATRAEAILAEYKRLGAPALVAEAACWGRLFGDGGIILGVEGSGALDEPLDDLRATKLEVLRVWDRQDLTPVEWDSFGQPLVYLWQPPATAGGTEAVTPKRVHRTRFLWFSGALTTARGRQRNRGWNHSVLQRVKNTLMSFDQMFASTDAMFADASQAIFKLQGLIQALAEADGTGTADVQARLTMMDFMRSSGKAVVLDAGDETGAGAESFEVVNRDTLGTLDKVIDKYYVRLAASARMPLTVLLGVAPEGKDATGESDLILWYNTVDVYRQEMLQPQVERLVRLVARSVKDADPDSWTVCWPELQRLGPLDNATAENMRVTSLVALTQGLIAQPEEAAISLRDVMRYGLSALKLDTKAREKALKDAMLEVENREMGEEEVVPGVSPGAKQSERKTPAKAARRQT
jgi:phage-related protein (TIGR01555 family)